MARICSQGGGFSPLKSGCQDFGPAAGDITARLPWQFDFTGNFNNLYFCLFFRQTAWNPRLCLGETRNRLILSAELSPDLVDNATETTDSGPLGRGAAAVAAALKALPLGPGIYRMNDSAGKV